jgi:hypothetical protein
MPSAIKFVGWDDRPLEAAPTSLKKDSLKGGVRKQHLGIPIKDLHLMGLSRQISL